jgi:hypothetical protein
MVDPRVEVEIVLEVWRSRFRSIRGALQQCGFHVSEPRPRGQEIVTFTARRLEGYRLGRSLGVRAVAEVSEILEEGDVVTGRVLSYSYQKRPRTEWRQVKVKADGRLLQAVLVPEEENRETTKLRAAKLHDCAVEKISVSKARSWLLRSNSQRETATLAVVILFLSIFGDLTILIWRFAPRLLTLVTVVSVASLGLVWLGKTRGLRTIAGQLAVVLTIIGLSSYVVTRYSYYAYYSNFHVVPEELGLDYRAVLNNQPWFVFYATSVLVVSGIAIFAIVRISLWLSQSVSFRIPSSVLVGTIVTPVTLFLLVLANDKIWTNAESAAQAVRSGDSPPNNSWFVWPDPPRVTIISPISMVPYARTLGQADLRMLGDDDSSYTIYDVVSGTTLRLAKPDSVVLVANGDTDRVVRIDENGFQPQEITVPPRRVRISVYDESQTGCKPADKQNSIIGEIFRDRRESTLDIQLDKDAEIDFNCSSGGQPVTQRLTLRVGNE